MVKRVLYLTVLLLSSCQVVKIKTPDGTVISSINTGDLGNIPFRDSTISAGGLSSLIAGNVSTGRESSFQETEPGYIIASHNGTEIKIGGVVNNSTQTARMWDGITSSIRNWVARLVAKDLFNTVNNNINQKEQTERAKSNDSFKEVESNNRYKESVSNNETAVDKLKVNED